MSHHTDVCYLVAKVLDSDNSGSLSSLLEAVEWAQQEGAKVYNLSMDGARYSNAANQLFDRISSGGAIVVASAGNGGSDGGYTYPGSYPSVVAVAAVGEDRTVAWFSQRNNRVDIAAPGRNVLSTVLTRGADNVIATMTSEGNTVGGIFAQRSRVPSGKVTGRLIECRNGNKDPCPGVSGQICMMDR